ncbi:MAG TPA: single-stranded-DNA-specific exonuclease RecJ [Anaerolineales bacterium]|nr:single-stranded-DNA-specific exonuclease RecJ [Anaerolineales bacterium]
MRRSRRWILPELPESAAWPGYSAPATAILLARGLRSPEEAQGFLAPTLGELNPPWSMTGMEAAVDRLLASIDRGEPITVYGDYDADGLCAATLLEGALRALGADVDVYLPSRFDEGYGLHSGSLERLAESGRRVVVSVDCGMRAVEEAEAARALGLTLIVTDHHEPGPVLPRAEVLINPRQSGDRYPEKNLAGAGVAFKLAQALSERRSVSLAPEALALTAVGTIADMVPLTGENRRLAARGLEALNHEPGVGLGALIESARLTRGRVSARDVGYLLGPRLNAAGRMGDPMEARRLLAAKDPVQARRAAASLEEANRLRQQQTLEATDAARAGLGETVASLSLLFASDESYSEGIIGLVAARLMEEFYRPAVVVSLGSEVSKGSARSVTGFDITGALDACAELLDRHGGHERAAGFTIRTERLDVLRSRLTDLADPVLSGEHGEPKLRIDALVSFDEIDGRLFQFVRKVEPCGSGNPEPVFASQGVAVVHRRAVGGQGEHLKLRLSQNGRFFSAIAFRQGSQAESLPGRVDVAFRLQQNDYWGTPEIELGIEDVRPAEAVNR